YSVKGYVLRLIFHFYPRLFSCKDKKITIKADLKKYLILFSICTKISLYKGFSLILIHGISQKNKPLKKVINNCGKILCEILYFCVILWEIIVFL
ncbi:MAG: hypothetical protein WBJ48_06560, partial [Bacteroidales bacterium]